MKNQNYILISSLMLFCGFACLVMLLILLACKKNVTDDPTGAEEARRIEQAIVGHNYKIESIKDQTGANAAAQFPACIADDRYFFKDRGTVVIIQGTAKCGQENTAEKNASWAIGFDDQGVSALQMPVFLAGQNFYTTREFVRSLFAVQTATGAVSLIFKVGSDTYTINLVQTL